jgi:HSP20 family molecular chaperone IbpA
VVGTDWTVDMFEQDGALVIEVGLSGVRFEDVSVMVQGSHLVISARHSQEDGVRRYHLRGRRVPREFVHEVMLPPCVRPDLATATYLQGLLRVCIPLGSDGMSSGRPIPLKDLTAVSAAEEAEGRDYGFAGEMEGSPAGAEAVLGGAASVPGSGVRATPLAAAVRRCALCDAWMDGAAHGAPPPPDVRIQPGLCPACQPAERKRD